MRICPILQLCACATFLFFEASENLAQSPAATGAVARPFAASTPRGGGALFESLPAEVTGVDFQMQLPDVYEHIREFTLLTVYGGMCAGDYDGDGLTDFYVTRPAGGNRLFKNLGEFRFRDVTAAAGIDDPTMQGSGATSTTTAISTSTRAPTAAPTGCF
jgi:hypothetical protein